MRGGGCNKNALERNNITIEHMYTRLKNKHKDAIEQRLQQIRSIARDFGWNELWHQEDNRKVRFQRDGTFFDVFYTTMTAVFFTEDTESPLGLTVQGFNKIKDESELIEVFSTLV